MARANAARASAGRPCRSLSAPIAYQVFAAHSRAYSWPACSNDSSRSNSSSARASSPRARWIRPSSQCSATALNREPPVGWPACEREPRGQLALGLAQHLPRDVDRGGQPVRQREIRQQRERPMRGAEPLLAPADERQAEVMPPVVGLERHRALRRRARVDAIAGPVEHESQRRPRLARLRIEPARLARVMGGQGERGHVGRRIGARHLELHDAGVGQPDMRRRVLGRAAQRALEDLARAGDPIAFEGFERRPPLDERAMRREQRIEPGVALARRHPRDGARRSGSRAAEPSRCTARRSEAAEQPAQARDRLLEAVVADRDVLPPGLEQVVLGDDLPGARHEQQQDIELPVGHRDRFPGGGQTTPGGIELERFEDEPRAGRHG